MPNLDTERARENMVERQVRTWDVLDPVVLDVMRAIARDHFVPEEYRRLAYADTTIPLGDGETMMQPKVEGRLVQALQIKDTDSILEIGTGSGYVTALLARLGAKVHSVDIREKFTAGAEKALKDLAFDNIRLETRDASKLDGFTEQYDCIAVTGSMPVLHDSFRERLAPGGRLFVIVGTDPVMEAQLHTRVAEDDWTVESLFDTSIPPLVNAWNPKIFRF